MMSCRTRGTKFFFNVILQERMNNLADLMLVFLDIGAYQSVVNEVMQKHFVKVSDDRKTLFEQLRLLAFSNAPPPTPDADDVADPPWVRRANIVFGTVCTFANTNLEASSFAEFLLECLQSDKKEQMTKWMHDNQHAWEKTARTFPTTVHVFYQENKSLWKAIGAILGYAAPGASPVSSSAPVALPDRPPAYTKDKMKEIGGHLYGYSNDGSAWIIIHAFGSSDPALSHNILPYDAKTTTADALYNVEGRTLEDMGVGQNIRYNIPDGFTGRMIVVLLPAWMQDSVEQIVFNNVQ